MHGTNNFYKEKAMPIDISLRAILTGIEIAENLKNNGTCCFLYSE